MIEDKAAHVRRILQIHRYELFDTLIALRQNGFDNDEIKEHLNMDAIIKPTKGEYLGGIAFLVSAVLSIIAAPPVSRTFHIYRSFQSVGDIMIFNETLLKPTLIIALCIIGIMVMVNKLLFPYLLKYTLAFLLCFSMLMSLISRGGFTGFLITGISLTAILYCFKFSPQQIARELQFPSAIGTMSRLEVALFLLDKNAPPIYLDVLAEKNKWKGTYFGLIFIALAFLMRDMGIFELLHESGRNEIISPPLSVFLPFLILGIITLINDQNVYVALLKSIILLYLGYTWLHLTIQIGFLPLFSSLYVLSLSLLLYSLYQQRTTLFTSFR